jgi:pimeloyl-ACP methyl ester carboxylesterase
VPPLIALPGTLLDRRSLDAALAGLDARIELLGVCATLDDELERLAALALRPTWWLGHSLGGIVALQLAARHPQVVAGLLLLAANARAAPAAAAPRRAAQWQMAQQEGLRALAHGKLGTGYGLPAGDALLASLAEQAEAVGVTRFGHQLAYAGQRPGLAQRGAWISVPVLALSAAEDTLCPPPQSAEIVALAAPGVPARHHLLAHAGHLFPMQHPAWVARRLRAFIHPPATPESPR